MDFSLRLWNYPVKKREKIISFIEARQKWSTGECHTQSIKLDRAIMGRAIICIYKAARELSFYICFHKCSYSVVVL